MFKKIFLVFVLSLVTVNVANAIPVGSFGEIDIWATGAERLSGYGGSWGGVDPVAALIGDDLTDGAINITNNDSFLLKFLGIANGPGADFLITEARFYPAVTANVTVKINGLENVVFGYGPNNKFLDSGLDLVLKNSYEFLEYDIVFDLYGAPLDLSDWGVPSGAIVNEITIIGESGSDIMGVGVLPIPEPSGLLLLGSGIVAMFMNKRKN